MTNTGTKSKPEDGVETHLVPTTSLQQGAGTIPFPTDPLGMFLFGPLIMFLNSMMQFQRNMMSGGMNSSAMGGNFKIVELRRDKDGNIVSIMEKW